MKTITALLFLLTFSAQSQSIVETLIPGYCTPMTKNPLCWERPTNPHIPPRICPSNKKCTTIKKVVETTGRRAKAQFTCSDSTQKKFDCSEVVDLYGKDIVGFAVKVTTKFYAVSHPGCHVIGGCQRCVEGMSYAEIDSSCQ